MYAATPEASKSRHLRLYTLTHSLFLVQATRDPPWNLMTRYDIQGTQGSKQETYRWTPPSTVPRPVPPLPMCTGSCSLDGLQRGAYSARCFLESGESSEKCKEGEIARRMRKLSHFSGKTARVKNHIIIKGDLAGSLKAAECKSVELIFTNKK